MNNAIELNGVIMRDDEQEISESVFYAFIDDLEKRKLLYYGSYELKDASEEEDKYTDNTKQLEDLRNKVKHLEDKLQRQKIHIQALELLQAKNRKKIADLKWLIPERTSSML